MATDPRSDSPDDDRTGGAHDLPDPFSGGHGHGSGVPDKTTFPAAWSDATIVDTILDVARNPDRPPTYLTGRRLWWVSGIRDGVAIEGLVSPGGEITTGFPTRGPGVGRTDDTLVPSRTEDLRFVAGESVRLVDALSVVLPEPVVAALWEFAAAGEWTEVVETLCAHLVHERQPIRPAQRLALADVLDRFPPQKEKYYPYVCHKATTIAAIMATG